MPVNLNFDGTALVKWAARPLVCRTGSYAKEFKRRKLIAIAKECASNLKIADWDVVVWPPADVTSGIVDILASTKQCSTPEGCNQVAWELCGPHHVHNPISMYVAKCFERIPRPWPKVFCLDYERFQVQSEEFFASLRDLVTNNGRVESIRILKTARAEFKNIGPLWAWNNSLRFQYHLPKWSSQLIQEYTAIWDSITCELEEVEVKPKSETKLKNFTTTLLSAMDIVVTEKLGLNYGLCNFMPAACPYPRPPPPPLEENLRALGSRKARIETISFPGRLASRFISLMLTIEYVAFLSSRLQRNSSVGRFTNKLTLRKKHVFNKWNQVKDCRMWVAFEAHLVDKGEGIPSHSILPAKFTEDIDHLNLMSQVLGGHHHQTLNLQLSIVDKSIEKGTEYDRESFLGKIGRRHVRLLKNGEDRALVIPYLNKILLKLANDQWVQANDVTALQPLAVDERLISSGAIRRAANILLALDYVDSGKPVVNSGALEVIKRYARKGELYSMEMRDELLSVVLMNSRVCIRALQTSAREVFGKDQKAMVSTLVREMIHDRVHMKSGLGPDRLKFGTENTRLNIRENDAYYDSIYLRRHSFVENNVCWGPGVSVLGTAGCMLRYYERDYRYFLSGREIEPSILKLKGTSDSLQTWVFRTQADDVDEASVNVADITSQEHFDLYPKINRLVTVSVNREMKLGKYCIGPITVEKKTTTETNKIKREEIE